jgi:hypothetical protein
MDVAHASPSRCTDPAERRLLFRYGIRRATESEQRSFERHILACDECFKDVLAVWRVSSLLDEWVDGEDGPAEGLPEMLRSTGRRRRLRALLAVVLAALAGFLLHAAL